MQADLLELAIHGRMQNVQVSRNDGNLKSHKIQFQEIENQRFLNYNKYLEYYLI